MISPLLKASTADCASAAAASPPLPSEAAGLTKLASLLAVLESFAAVAYAVRTTFEEKVCQISFWLIGRVGAYGSR